MSLPSYYKTTITTELDNQQFSEFENLMTRYPSSSYDLIKKVDEGDYNSAKELFPAVSKLRTDMETVLQKESKHTVDRAKDDYDNSQFSYKNAYVQIIGMTAIGLFIAVILGLVISLTISRHIKKVLIVAHAL